MKCHCTTDLHKRRRAVLLVLVSGALTTAGWVRAEEPLVRSVDVSAGASHYDSGLGTANGQGMRLGLARTGDFSLFFDLGREQRFGDQSVNVGVGGTRTLAGITYGASLSTGTGEFIAPRYRFDASVMRPFGDLQATLSYTRLQSRAENSSDALGLGLVRWYGHWILGAVGRVEMGHPGRATSFSGGCSLTWYTWKEIYAGVGFDTGHVSYQLLGPGRADLVDYATKGYNMTFARWFARKSGIKVRVDLGETSFYTVRGGTLGYFMTW